MRNKAEQEKLREAIKKLRSSGHSIKRIALVLNCSPSTVSVNCVDVEILDKDAYNSSVEKATRTNALQASKKASERWEICKESFRKEARQEWQWIKQGRYGYDFLSFLALYWAEGTKKSGYIAMTNNDPGIIKLSLQVFDKHSPNKVKDVIVKCYPEHDKAKCKAYWEKLLGRPVRIKDKTWLGKKRRMHSQYGLCVAQYSDVVFYTKILTWLDLWRKEILQKERKESPKDVPVGT